MYQTSMFFSAETSAEILQKLLRGSETARSGQLKTIPRLNLVSGVSLSVQASSFHRCLPRSNIGPYTHVEVAWPTEEIDALLPYMQREDGIDPTHAIYDYVPVDLILDIIVENGGLRL